MLTTDYISLDVGEHTSLCNISQLGAILSTVECVADTMVCQRGHKVISTAGFTVPVTTIKYRTTL